MEITTVDKRLLVRENDAFSLTEEAQALVQGYAKEISARDSDQILLSRERSYRRETIQKFKWSLAVWLSVVVMAGASCSPDNLNGGLASRMPTETTTDSIGTARGPADDETAQPEAPPAAEKQGDVLGDTQTTPVGTERSVLDQPSPDPSQLPERVPLGQETLVTGEVPAPIW